MTKAEELMMKARSVKEGTTATLHAARNPKASQTKVTPKSRTTKPSREGNRVIIHHPKSSKSTTMVIDANPGKGRVSKLTPEVQETVCRLVREGNYLSTAARAAGICDATRILWMNKAKEEVGCGITSSIYIDFFVAVQEAEAVAQRQLLCQVAQAAQEPKLWGAAAWILERRWASMFGRNDKTKLEVTGADGDSIKHEVKVNVVRVEDIAQALTILSDVGAVRLEPIESSYTELGVE